MYFHEIEADDNQSDEIFLQQGIPTEWDIVNDANCNIFGDNMFTFSCNEKNQCKKTGDIGDMSEEQLEEDYPFDFEDISAQQSCLVGAEVEEIIEITKQNLNPVVQLASEVGNQKKTKRIYKKKSNKRHKKRKFSSKKKKFKGDISSETKNIPKNYGKQIIKFIKKERQIVNNMLVKTGSRYSYEKLISEIKKKKKTINKISDLRKIWMSFDFSKQIRILTGLFLRKYSLAWIFNSRIENIKNPIKYRYKIEEGVRQPGQFFYLKDF